jgi:hypothetical protein
MQALAQECLAEGFKRIDPTSSTGTRRVGFYERVGFKWIRIDYLTG